MKNNSGNFRLRLPVLGCLLFIFSGIACAETSVVLTENHEPKCVIVLSGKESISEKWAAEELKTHLKLISGADIKIVKEPEKNLLSVYVGAAGWREFDEEGFKDFSPDEYLIKVKKDFILIAGGKDRGTLYGVYTLLERLGCRWWTPTESSIPEEKTITLSEFELQEKPKLELRDLAYNDIYNEKGKLWAARNKLNGWKQIPEQYGGAYKYGGGGLAHTYFNLLKNNKDIKPEMLAFVNGRREEKLKRNVQLCLTNPDVVLAMAEAVKKEWRKTPGLKFITVSQEDGYDYCRCENCAKLAKEEGSESAPVIYFVNKVADAVKKDIPKAFIATTAYAWSQTPPKTLRPASNVYIILCSYECDFGHPIGTSKNEANVIFRKDLEAWSKISSKIIIWDYSTNFLHYLMPYPNLDSPAENISYYIDNKVTGVMELGPWDGTGTEFAQLRLWVLAKILWQPASDSRALIKEFVEGYYGPAAPAILKYIETIHRYIREHKDFVLNIYRHTNVPFIAPGIIAEAEVYLREAEKAVENNEVYMKRVAHAHMPVWYVLLKMGVFSPMWKEVEAKAGKTEIKEVARKFNGVVKDFNIQKSAEGQSLNKLIKCIEDYGSISEKKVTEVLKINTKDTGNLRLIHSWQLDRGEASCERAGDASAGWALKTQKSKERQVQHYFSDTNDFKEGVNYSIFVRCKVKGISKELSGEVIEFGVNDLVIKKIKADEINDENWHIFELGKTKLKGIGCGFWSKLNLPDRLEALYIDCIWLVETGK